MGSKLSGLCSDDRDEKARDYFLKNGYEKFFCISDDYEYFFNHENWVDSISNPLYDPDKLLLSYSDYKFNQVGTIILQLKKNWIGKNGQTLEEN